MRPISSIGKDYGVLLPFKCTVCDWKGSNLVKLHDKTISSYLKLLMRLALMTKPKNWIFYCEQCELQTDIPEQEVEMVLGLHKQYEQLERGELELESYLTELLKNDSKTIQDLYSRSRAWDCPECETKVPPTFETCWNCGTDCPEPSLLIAFDEQLDISSDPLFGTVYKGSKQVKPTVEE